MIAEKSLNARMKATRYRVFFFCKECDPVCECAPEPDVEESTFVRKKQAEKYGEKIINDCPTWGYNIVEIKK